jgi:hypothetical protein
MRALAPTLPQRIATDAFDASEAAELLPAASAPPPAQSHCTYCAVEQKKLHRSTRPIKAWRRCATCIKSLALISATVAKKTYYIAEDVLEPLECVQHYHYYYKTYCTYYLKRDVINAAIVAWKGPGALLARMNRRHAPTKAGEERKAKIAALIPDPERRKAMEADGSWALCVEPFMKNGVGGVQEVKARLRRFEVWTEIGASYPVVTEYRTDFVNGECPVDRVRGIVERHTALVSGLEAVGLSLRQDSRLCKAHIHDNAGTLEEVVATMKEMDWLYKHTNYAERLRDACDEIVFNIHNNHGWLEQEEFDTVFQEEKDEASHRIRAKFRDQYRKWCAKKESA